MLEPGAEMRGLDRAPARHRAEEVAERLDIQDRLDHKIASLSRGLSQRAAIARAIIHAPKFVILDEPAAGLDPDARLRLSALFLKLRDDGMTLLVSSHILAELEDYCTDMVIIQDGRLVDGRVPQGRPREIEIALAGSDARLAGLLGGFAGVGAISLEGGVARFELSGGSDAQAALLRDLVEAGLAVVRFTERTERLQDAYRRAIAGGNGGASDGARGGTSDGARDSDGGRP